MAISITFKPMQVKDMTQLAIEMADVPVRNYHYSANGSTVVFSGRQFGNFVSFLQKIVDDPEMDSESKAEARDTLAYVQSKVGTMNPLPARNLSWTKTSSPPGAIQKTATPAGDYVLSLDRGGSYVLNLLTNHDVWIQIGTYESMDQAKGAANTDLNRRWYGIQNPTGGETTAIVLSIAGLVGLGALLYFSSKKSSGGTVAPPSVEPGNTPNLPGGGGGGVTDTSPNPNGGLPSPGTTASGTPIAPPLTLPPPWTNAVSNGAFTLVPGKTYRWSMLPIAGTTFHNQSLSLAHENGFSNLQGWGGTAPSDWPPSDTQSGKWYFEFNYTGTAPQPKTAQPDWAVYVKS